ncbi:MAG: gliding motility-associated C-terminal domain-containing protein [Bacteroidales bacterium]|nr:gliding motility-associated C-terminal domain-containing protein [Bacteroidales bacterium]
MIRQPLTYLNILTISLMVYTGVLHGQDNYYWVGGQGNWSEISHWATSSGGTTFHIEIPSGDDHVIFDQNSFAGTGDTVFVDAGNNVCGSMTWSNVPYKPTLTGADTLLFRIYQSLTLDTGMVWDYRGTLAFEDTLGGQTIRTADHQFYNDVYFNGKGGQWTLLDSLKIADTVDFFYRKIIFNAGHIITNGQGVKVEGLSSISTEERILDIRNSTLLIEGSWQVYGTHLTVLAEPSLIQATEFVTNIDGDYLVFDDIEFTGPFSGLLNSNIRSRHDVVYFHGSGIMEGNFTADSVTFVGNGLDSCMVNGTDTINVIHLQSFGRIMGENHRIHKVVGDDFLKFTGHGNHVDSALINGIGLVTGTNDFDVLLFNTLGVMDGFNYCDHAIFSADGEIYGMNTYDSLSFTPGFFYMLENDSVQTVLSYFRLMGECEHPIMMTSDINTVQARIHYMASGGLHSEYLALRDIRITGPGPFTVDYAVDLGNNSGWMLNPMVEKDLYWVGGTGNWDDRNHWSLSSGGPGGECPPTAVDNVFFDENSFSGANQVVTVNVKYGICHNMDWSGAAFEPVFVGPDTNNLRIYGSLTFVPGMNMSFPGKVYFESTEMGDTVTMSGHFFFRNTYFQGRNGGWKLLDDYSTLDTLFFLHGTLNTNDQTIEVKNFNSADTTTRTLLLGKSEITVTQQMADAWWLNGANLTFDGDESTIHATGPLEGHVRSDNSAWLVYNNVFIYGLRSQLKNNAICKYNLVTFFNAENESNGNCSIDTLTFMGPFGAVRNNDTINVVECRGVSDTIAGGFHIIHRANFYENGIVYGMNQIDTLFFYSTGLMQFINTVDTAVFVGEVAVEGRNTFNKLTLTKGCQYTFERDSTQTIVDRWTANGDCTGSIILQSDATGRQAYIRKVNGPVMLDYVSIRDIHAIGSQIPFKAINAIDLGNNTNWEITQPDPLGLYWVNGQGSWDDPFHWAAYSGGPGNYCVPKEIDDVYFDENSFLTLEDTVLVNVNNAVCRNMDWTGSAAWLPTFLGADTNKLIIYGSLTLNNGMINRFSGPVIFEEIGAKYKSGKSPTDSIRTFGRLFLNNIYFQGVNGGWTLLDSLSTMRNIEFVHGHLTVNSQKINCSRFLSNYQNDRILDITNSTIDMSVINFDAWYMDGTNVILFADNSLLHTSGYACHIKNKNGTYLRFHDVMVDGVNAGIYNYDNVVEFNRVDFNAELGHTRGNYVINRVKFYGDFGSMLDHSETNTALFYGTNGTIEGTHDVGTATFFAKGKIINNNHFGHCTFMVDGDFFGTNFFDTLTLTPGGTYRLQSGKTQTIHDQMNVRANNCFGISLKSITPGLEAYIFKEADTVVGDFMEIRDIHATGNALFYAGGYSENLGNVEGWIFDNAPGYIFGFGDMVQRFCYGSEYEITTENFNGTSSTQYFWNNSNTPGDPSLVVTEPGTYYLVVDYSEDCTILDTVVVEADLPPVAIMDEGPFCEGEVIGLDVFPRGLQYTYKWFDESEEPHLDASIDLTGSTVWVEVTDTLTGCTTRDEKEIIVKETPDPEDWLGEDQTLVFGESILLNAGPGDTWSWSTDDPLVVIDNATLQSIEAIGTPEGVTYTVVVDLAGCKGSGSILLGEYPRCAAAVPTAFTPNGDGVNDILYVRGNGLVDITFLLFDRYGKLVFQTTDLDQGWDGYTDSGKQENEVYTYYLKAVCADGGLIETEGNITVLR